MKKLSFLLIATLILPMAMQAKNPKTPKLESFSDSYIYAQSGRNSEKKGSCLSLTTGLTYSLQNASDKTSTNDIDLMLFFGKAYGGKTKVFHLFAPNDPGITIDWDKDGGTSPFCKFEGKSEDPNAYFALKNWKVRNATKLQKITTVDFDKATPDTIAALPPITDTYAVSDVKVGDVIYFELAATSMKPGKKGLIKITALEDDETKPDQKGNAQYQRFIVSIKIEK
jgi:hypothetical protein